MRKNILKISSLAAPPREDLKRLKAMSRDERMALIRAEIEAGRDDALIGVGRAGRIALNFDREAESACAAVARAVSEVKAAIPEARLIEVVPDPRAP